ncbi:MAG: hypothetical protein IPN79_04395 [Saprospiraceae bacterium]|nr:hypothetical protein [Saprospiraceae bacterium]
MRNVILNVVLFLSVLLTVACEKENKKSQEIYPPCVGLEENSDTLTGFVVFEKGEQEFGYVKGTKINKPYEASTFINIFSDSVFKLTMVGYWPEYKGHSAEAERLGLNNIPIESAEKCYSLTNTKNSKDSINVSYIIVNDDVGILLYKLDESADNKLEIISFDKTTQKFKARLKASFIGEKEYLPDLPKHVRFIDTYIEHGY